MKRRIDELFGYNNELEGRVKLLLSALGNVVSGDNHDEQRGDRALEGILPQLSPKLRPIETNFCSFGRESCMSLDDFSESRSIRQDQSDVCENSNRNRCGLPNTVQISSHSRSIPAISSSGVTRLQENLKQAQAQYREVVISRGCRV